MRPRARAPNKGFARRPQEFLGWEEWEWGYEEWRGAGGRARARRTEVSQGARTSPWPGTLGTERHRESSMSVAGPSRAWPVEHQLTPQWMVQG